MELFTPVVKPPFCPNRDCPHHLEPEGFRYHRAGHHLRKHAPFKVRRYQCVACRRTFSDQTFRLGYWCRRQDLFEPIFQASQACAAQRQIVRQLGLTRDIVACRIERLGRHCLLLNEVLRPKGPATEPFVFDGFETFEYSQFAPMHVNFLVGAVSWLIHGVTESELRRKGRMTDSQRRTRDKLEELYGRPDPKAVEKGVLALLETFLPDGQSVILRSDEHPAYRTAIAKLGGNRRIEHQVTSSKAPRTPLNPLFAVNLTDLLFRHGSSNHKRETIAFSKRRQAVVSRAWMFVVWRNFLKSRSENRRNAPPAVALGIVKFRPTCDELFARRLFPTKIELPEALKPHYWHRIVTRYLARQRTHDLKYAY